MRRPRLHQLFPVPSSSRGIGLADLLASKDDSLIDEAMHIPPEVEDGRLTILPCGSHPDIPAELLDSPRALRLLGLLKERFDIVVIDSPPVLPVIDPVILAQQVDGVILVTRCKSTTRVDIQRTITSLKQGDVNFFGVVLNEVDPRAAKSRYYNSHYYSYRADPSTESAALAEPS